MPPAENHHERMAIRLLSDERAQPFLLRIGKELVEEFRLKSVPNTPERIVQGFVARSADDVLRLFDVVRRALAISPSSDGDISLRHAIEGVAAALYCIAACRVIDQAAYAAHITAAPGNQYVIPVPTPEPLICAVIATALFGGELHLVTSEDPQVPSPEFAFTVQLPTGGDQIEEDFERAAYLAVFARDRYAPSDSLDDGPLNPDQRQRLAARLRTIQSTRRKCLTLVVRNVRSSNSYEGFATKHRVPIMVPTTDATTALLGMSAEALLAEIREFWSELQAIVRPPSQSHEPPSSPAPSGVTPMSSSSGTNINITATTVALTTGDKSPAQAGSSHNAHVGDRQGADPSALIPMFQELLRAISEQPSRKAQQTLTAQVQLAQAEVSKAEKADPDVIKRALEATKSGAEVLENGAKIISLCSKAYNAVGPLFGLPPSPLP